MACDHFVGLRNFLSLKLTTGLATIVRQQRNDFSSRKFEASKGDVRILSDEEASV